MKSHPKPYNVGSFIYLFIHAFNCTDFDHLILSRFDASVHDCCRKVSFLCSYIMKKINYVFTFVRSLSNTRCHLFYFVFQSCSKTHSVFDMSVHHLGLYPCTCFVLELLYLTTLDIIEPAWWVCLHRRDFLQYIQRRVSGNEHCRH